MSAALRPGESVQVRVNGIHDRKAPGRLTGHRPSTKIYFVRSAFLTKRGHIDLLRVASAACRRSI
ncbi:putative leader peptide [Micromonospora sp. NPDC050417]|uniref:putative leader peptide n=1 Tax=Micromonospora sp. NPDC050417 TaxID=3364280 RepID=UPI0037AC9D18